MKYLIILLLAILNSYADMSCRLITDNMDEMNKARLEVKHFTSADKIGESQVQGQYQYNPTIQIEKLDEEESFYSEHDEKSLSYYLKQMNSTEYTEAQKMVFHEIIKEIGKQKEMKVLNKLQKYYAQKYIQAKCSDENLTDSQLQRKNLCATFMNHVGDSQVDSLSGHMGQILMHMSLEDQLISQKELHKLCLHNKKIQAVSQACASVDMPSKCPRKMEFVGKKCMPKCIFPQIRNSESPSKCIRKEKLEIQARESKIRSKAAWGTVGRTAAVIVAAGGAITLGAWAITSMTKNRTKKYEHTYNHEYKYTYKYPQSYGYENSYGNGYGNSFNYNSPYSLYSQYPLQPQQSSSTPYWDDQSSYSFGF